MKKLISLTILLGIIGIYTQDLTPAFFGLCLIGLEKVFNNEKYYEVENEQ